jgi:nucleoside triphosphate pyrophosphatase
MPLWLASQPLVLASRSEARRGMLEAAGIPLEIVAAETDERGIEQKAAGRAPQDIAALLARAKAKAVAASRPGRLVIGGDQTLALGGRLFAKPQSRADAREQLRALRGKTHTLHSAVAVMRDGERLFEHADSARMTMRGFSDEFLEAYLYAAGAAAETSVGGYQWEKLGIQLFDRVEGDHFTILGLPLLPLIAWLRQSGLLAR